MHKNQEVRTNHEEKKKKEKQMGWREIDEEVKGKESHAESDRQHDLEGKDKKKKRWSGANTNKEKSVK